MTDDPSAEEVDDDTDDDEDFRVEPFLGESPPRMFTHAFYFSQQCARGADFISLEYAGRGFVLTY